MAGRRRARSSEGAWDYRSQPRIDRRDVKDRNEDVTHQPEQITACQDTWKLGSLMTTEPGDWVLDPTCVRVGTRVLTPLDPPVNGGIPAGTGLPSPLTGRARVGSVPIEALRPGDWVLGHDGQPHRVLRTIRKRYRGRMVGIQHDSSEQTLWVTADHRILCRRRTQSYGAERSWRHVPQEHFARARTLRKEMTDAERRLWHRLRGEQLGVKFRKQHPIGPYIVDFYSWQAGLVVELDGETHATPEARAYDQERDNYLQSLGLSVLRFSNREVFTNLEGVLEAITIVLDQTEPSERHDREWRRADSLTVGGIVYFSPELRPVEVTRLSYEQTEEEVYDLEVESAHSFLTEVCAVHNCGSGTTACCAEKWGPALDHLRHFALAIACQGSRIDALGPIGNAF